MNNSSTMSNVHTIDEHSNNSFASNQEVAPGHYLNVTNATKQQTLTDMIMPKMDNMMDVFEISCSIAVIFGGLIPYIPQYIKIKKSGSSDGFSTYVCLTLLLANILRIAFWFGHHFELPLLIQSFVMIVGMMAMMDICIRVRNIDTGYVVSSIGLRPNTVGIRRSLLGSAQDMVCRRMNPNRLQMQTGSLYYISATVTYIGLNRHCFWDWDDHFSYLKFLVYFSSTLALVTYLLINNYLYVESLGFVAVFMESLLGVPQLLRNYRKKSTRGMSVEMVIMWLSGDIFKTLYFIFRKAPAQFIACGSIQVIVDLLIIVQVVLCRHQVTYCRLPKST